MPDTNAAALKNAAYRAAAEEHGAAAAAAAAASVFDDAGSPSDSSTSGSLLSASVIRHNIKCECGERVSMWFARCPACGVFLQR